MRRKGLQSTKDKPPDTDLEDNIKTNVVVFTTLDPITTKEGKIYLDLCRRYPPLQAGVSNILMLFMCMTVMPS